MLQRLTVFSRLWFVFIRFLNFSNDICGFASMFHYQYVNLRLFFNPVFPLVVPHILFAVQISCMIFFFIFRFVCWYLFFLDYVLCVLFIIQLRWLGSVDFHVNLLFSIAYMRLLNSAHMYILHGIAYTYYSWFRSGSICWLILGACSVSKTLSSISMNLVC